MDVPQLMGNYELIVITAYKASGLEIRSLELLSITNLSTTSAR